MTTKSWLPVPHRPDTDQVSLISTSAAGSTIMRIGGWRPSSTMQWAMNQWAVLAAAGERPLAGDPEPAIDRRGHARRVEGATQDDVGAVGVHGVERLARQLAEQHRRRVSDHHRPPDRAVGPGQLLDHPHLRGQVELGAAVAAGHQRPEAARRRQLLHQIRRHPPTAFDLLAARLDDGRQRDNRLEGFIHLNHLTGHGFLPLLND